MLRFEIYVSGIIHAGLFAQALTYIICPARILACSQGWLSHAILDVFQKEPLSSSSPLWGHPKITITPHIAGITQEVRCSYTKNEMSSYWRNFHHWPHRKLSSWQFHVQSIRWNDINSVLLLVKVIYAIDTACVDMPFIDQGTARHTPRILPSSRNAIPVKVILDISGSPTESQWGSRKYPG